MTDSDGQDVRAGVDIVFDMRIHRLHLTEVTPSPDLPWARPTFPVYGYLIDHPDGRILVDTGVGIGNAFIDELYSPVHHDLDTALAGHGTTVGDVRVVVSSHLHFDHCGQNRRFGGATIVVQRAEVEAAHATRYTVPDWAFPPQLELSVVDGEATIANGVRVIPTPGHTPGHQSVVVEDGEGVTVICAQASWSAATFAAESVGDEHAWDIAFGDSSVRALHELQPGAVLFSHDPTVWTPASSP